jgi:putative membrane protein
MINNYREHAANERTFLAWLRTALAIVAFGVLVQKLIVPASRATDTNSALWSLQGIVSDVVAGLPHYAGLALALIGVVIIVLGGFQFVRTAREIESPELHAAGMRFELLLTGALAFLAAAICVFFSVA